MIEDRAQQTEAESLRAENTELKRENFALKCAPRPRAFDLKRLAEWGRLARETRGYLNTCKRDHHGTDFAGRELAMAGLDALANAVQAELDARASLTPESPPKEAP